jgi:hypothetical protein
MQSVTVKSVCVFSGDTSGVVHLSQGMSDNFTRITGTITGLAPDALIELRATLFGDLSDKNFKTIGGSFSSATIEPLMISSDSSGTSKFDINSSIKLIGPLSIIGRCLAIISNPGRETDEKIITAAIVGIAAIPRDGQLALN